MVGHTALARWVIHVPDLPAAKISTDDCHMHSLLDLEKSRRFPFSIQVKDDALGRIRWGSPPRTGTSHVSQGAEVP